MFHELRQLIRSLFKQPAFVLTAVTTLALGIGANTAIFSVVEAVLLRPLAYPDQHQLVWLAETGSRSPLLPTSYPNARDWSKRQSSFSALGAFRTRGYNFTGRDLTERLGGAMVTAEFFQVFGVAPVRGRGFTTEEDRPGGSRAVVVRESFWRRQLESREDVVGSEIRLSGDLYTIVGVMPDTLQFPAANSEIWTPLGQSEALYNRRNMRPGIFGIARLKDGVELAAARTDMNRLMEELEREHPEGNTGQRAVVSLLTERTTGPVRPALLTLLGAALFLLLIACANVANLMLSRAQARGREFAVRAALGASRMVIVRQLLLESAFIGVLGGAAGLLLGLWTIDALRTVLPANLPRVQDIGLNSTVFAFAVGASLLTSLAFGLAPARHAARRDVREALAAGGRGVGGRSGRMSSVLIVGQYALTCILLAGAGLMFRTLVNLQRAEPGFRTDGVATFSWVLPDNSIAPADRLQHIDRALEQLATIPGVNSVGVVNPLPFGSGNQNPYYVEGAPLPAKGEVISAEYIEANGGYFDAMDINLVAGRLFDARDRPGSPRVIIVDRVFVERNFPGQDPIGRRVVYGRAPPEDPAQWMEIIGVVEHIKDHGVTGPSIEQTYVPHTQSIPAAMTFTLGTALEPAALSPAIRSAMREVLADSPVFAVQSLQRIFHQSIATQRLSLVLLGVFAGLAVVLAAVGLFGVLSYHVGQRTREFGIRSALGATPRGLVRQVLREGGGLALLGLALGAVGAVTMSGALQSLLYGVRPFDLATLAAASALLGAVGFLACLLPARRAAQTDPMEALRAD